MLWYLALETFAAVCSDTAARMKKGTEWYNALALAVGNAFILWTVVYILGELLGSACVSFEMFVMCIACGLALQIDGEVKDSSGKVDGRVDG